MIRSDMRWYRACNVSLLGHPILASNVSPLPCTMFLNPELSFSWSRKLSQVFSILVPCTPPPPRHHSMMIHCVDHLFLISAAPCVLTIHSRLRQLCIIQFWLHQLSCTICCTVCTIFAETLPTKSENGVLRKAVCSASDVRVLFLLYSCPVFALF